MCGQFTLSFDSGMISERFEVSLIDWEPRCNIASSVYCPVVRKENEQRHLDFMQWGLIPHWSQDKKIGSHFINFCAKSVRESSIFCKVLQAKRCLVLADSFVGWKETSLGKVPFSIKLKGGELFAFAGIWDVWHGENGEEIKSFTILTTDSNGLVGQLGDQMPIILKKENEALWLDPNFCLEKLDEILKPISQKEMVCLKSC